MYRSPFHILFHFNSDVTADFNFKRLQQQYLAEFNLQASSVLLIGGFQYSKDEIIKSLEAIKNFTDLPHHLLIYQNKPVLQFLEDTRQLEDVTAILTFCDGPKDPDFFTFFQKIFTDAFKLHLSHVLKNRLYEKYDDLKKLEPFILISQAEVPELIIAEHFVLLTALIRSWKDPLSNTLNIEITSAYLFLKEKSFITVIGRLTFEFENIRQELLYALSDFISAAYYDKAIPRAFLLEIVNNFLDCKHIDESVFSSLENTKYWLAQQLAEERVSLKLANAYHLPYGELPQIEKVDEYENKAGSRASAFEYETVESQSATLFVRSLLDNKWTTYIVLILIFIFSALAYYLWETEWADAFFSLAICFTLVLPMVIIARRT